MKNNKSFETVIDTYTHMNLKNKKGITLIALVITIIVLLILSLITITYISRKQ